MRVYEMKLERGGGAPDIVETCEWQNKGAGRDWFEAKDKPIGFKMYPDASKYTSNETEWALWNSNEVVRQNSPTLYGHFKVFAEEHCGYEVAVSVLVQERAGETLGQILARLCQANSYNYVTQAQVIAMWEKTLVLTDRLASCGTGWWNDFHIGNVNLSLCGDRMLWVDIEAASTDKGRVDNLRGAVKNLVRFINLPHPWNSFHKDLENNLNDFLSGATAVSIHPGWWKGCLSKTLDAPSVPANISTSDTMAASQALPSVLVSAPPVFAQPTKTPITGTAAPANISICGSTPMIEPVEAASVTEAAAASQALTPRHPAVVKEWVPAPWVIEKWTNSQSTPKTQPAEAALGTDAATTSKASSSRHQSVVTERPPPPWRSAKQTNSQSTPKTQPAEAALGTDAAAASQASSSGQQAGVTKSLPAPWPNATHAKFPWTLLQFEDSKQNTTAASRPGAVTAFVEGDDAPGHEKVVGVSSSGQKKPRVQFASDPTANEKKKKVMTRIHPGETVLISPRDFTTLLFDTPNAVSPDDGIVGTANTISEAPCGGYTFSLDSAPWLSLAASTCTCLRVSSNYCVVVMAAPSKQR